MSKNITTVLLAAIVALIVSTGVALVGGNSQSQVEDNRVGAGTRFPNGISADNTSPSAGEVRGTTLTTTGAATLGGAATLSSTLDVTGQVTLKETAGSITGTTSTITTADSFTTYYVSAASGTTITLPAVASSAGVHLKFVIASAFDTANVVIDSAEGDNVEGTLIVAGAVVDCDAEDQINFVNDGENLGDYVELRSDGSSWYIGDSGALTAAKLTCTDPS